PKPSPASKAAPKSAPTPPPRPAPAPIPAPTPPPARELRPDRGDTGTQISVQDLLRRSRSEQSDDK
ncbi:MAG: hypothetical protein WBG39_10385, partial [Gordonia sp. (in: high G+C Gram-positive bacteria)]